MREYLQELQRRYKWLNPKINVKVGDLVLVTDPIAPRGLWQLGRVIDVKLGRDALVRSVKLRTKTSELVRPITKIVLLEGMGKMNKC